MKLWSHIKSALRNLFTKQQVESQLDDEVRAYVDMMTDERIAAGMSASEARRTALAEFGGIEQVKQAVREHRAGAGVGTRLAGCTLRIAPVLAQSWVYGDRDFNPGAFHRRKHRDFFHRECAHAEEPALFASRADGHDLHAHHGH